MHQQVQARWYVMEPAPKEGLVCVALVVAGFDTDHCTPVVVGLGRLGGAWQELQ